jgi:ABC-type phosphate transport system permease subunit
LNTLIEGKLLLAVMLLTMAVRTQHEALVQFHLYYRPRAVAPGTHSEVLLRRILVVEVEGCMALGVTAVLTFTALVRHGTHFHPSPCFDDTQLVESTLAHT